jgi:hypothetical protein
LFVSIFDWFDIVVEVLGLWFVELVEGLRLWLILVREELNIQRRVGHARRSR